MNDTRELLLSTANEIFEDRCTVETIERAKKEGWSADLWRIVEEAEFPLIAVPEAAGGAGAELADAAVLVHAVGAYAAPIPLAETALLAAPALAQAGLEIPRGALAIAPAMDSDALTLRQDGAGWRLSGTARRVPFARHAVRVVAVAQSDGSSYVASVDPASVRIAPGSNLASEARDDVHFDNVGLAADAVAAAPGLSAVVLQRRGALARAILMGGALERTLTLSIAYAMEREQFGRPIGRFQTIQQYLALIAAEVAAAKAAIAAAVEAGDGEGAEFATAVAKIRAGQAADQVCTLAHQIHGAIGFTEEHRLHHFTTRLWAWRDEFGNESQWAERLGKAVVARGAEALWPTITD